MRAALEEHQTAIEHIMSKYRQHTTQQIYKSRTNWLAFQEQQYNQIIKEQAEKIQEMAAVMEGAAYIDETRSNREEEIISKLRTENKVYNIYLHIIF